LAALHRQVCRRYGAVESNYIGTLRQSCAWRESWVEFWRDERLAPQVERARGRLGTGLVTRLDRVLARLDRWLPDRPVASQLHGDLWGGNWLETPEGPALFDPSAYAGDREVDLAMMALFGGFPEPCERAYNEAWPLDPGAEERRPLYQLYPLLVHVNLFGGGYVNQVDSVVGRYV
jgi:fructosamine-3-kinase